MLAYTHQPQPDEVIRLTQRFDDLFSTVAGYDTLDDQIAKTKAKKDSLLMALAHPEIPLHNSDSGLDARRYVHKRDVSLGPRTQDSQKAWDTFLSLSPLSRSWG